LLVAVNVVEKCNDATKGATVGAGLRFKYKSAHQLF
jgi:hypothetical protein